MPLNIDHATETDYALLIDTLRATRIASGHSQNTIAPDLSVRAAAICEWETGQTQPTLGHLIRWARLLNHRLVVIGPDGAPLHEPSDQRPNETWEHFQRRRLAAPLSSRRLTLGMAQEDLGRLVGVSRASISRWELVTIPPQPRAHLVWARKLGCAVALRPAGSRQR